MFSRSGSTMGTAIHNGYVQFHSSLRTRTLEGSNGDLVRRSNLIM